MVRFYSQNREFECLLLMHNCLQNLFSNSKLKEKGVFLSAKATHDEEKKHGNYLDEEQVGSK